MSLIKPGLERSERELVANCSYIMPLPMSDSKALMASECVKAGDANVRCSSKERAIFVTSRWSGGHRRESRAARAALTIASNRRAPARGQLHKQRGAAL